MQTIKRSTMVLTVLAVALLTTACPTQDELTKAAHASNELAHDLVIANKSVAALYTAHRISLSKKDQWAAQLSVIGDKGEALNNTLVELDRKYPEGTVPPQNLQFVRDNLAQLQQLYGALFGDVLSLVGKKSADAALGSFGSHIDTIKEVANK